MALIVSHALSICTLSFHIIDVLNGQFFVIIFLFVNDVPQGVGTSIPGVVFFLELVGPFIYYKTRNSMYGSKDDS